ncbi:MAG: hypothetical protein DMF69_17290 [Acidobacteria bacterium]|nr:MAG: hypothetical protein DMF69_17290 [Acidobacteriota bacterium]
MLLSARLHIPILRALAISWAPNKLTLESQQMFLPDASKLPISCAQSEMKRLSLKTVENPRQVEGVL